MSTTYFCNNSCDYFPCHEGIKKENFSCMFCYCPLYALKDQCGGNFSYTDSGIKDCSNCLLPHERKNYDLMLQRIMLLIEITRKQTEASAV